MEREREITKKKRRERENDKRIESDKQRVKKGERKEG